ncbi:hypothetical protein BpHYR1_028225 [Brachionus plicatilis]|uniref:Uncharacterized protein n=1 Tax=Brachionus plicatilis TaxID=10195 RepID=A0A3M7R710_BRAPC|nr:hypothetical protein BpHYR1_028225 [Brachionus plicatilis]
MDCRPHLTYIGINCHIIDSEWESKTLLLDCKKIQSIEYGLSEKLHTVITDNAANMYAVFDEVSLSGFNANLDDILKKYESSIENVAQNSPVVRTHFNSS